MALGPVDACDHIEADITVVVGTRGGASVLLVVVVVVVVAVVVAVARDFAASFRGPSPGKSGLDWQGLTVLGRRQSEFCSMNARNCKTRVSAHSLWVPCASCVLAQAVRRPQAVSTCFDSRVALGTETVFGCGFKTLRVLSCGPCYMDMNALLMGRHGFEALENRLRRIGCCRLEMSWCSTDLGEIKGRLMD